MALTQINPALFAGATNTTAVIQSNGTTAITVDSSQNVGIGTATPTAKLTVNNATATDYLSLTTAGSTKGVLADEAGDLIIKSAASLLFQTNGSIRARLNTTGAFVLAGGTTTANGIGITFPATQSASSDANTLDDYEEGTWTPVPQGSTVVGTPSGASTGFYVKIGRLVVATFDLNQSLSGASGNLVVAGFPFAGGGGAFAGAASIGYFASASQTATSYTGYMDNGASRFNMTYTNGSATTISYGNASGWSGRFIGQITYTTYT